MTAIKTLAAVLVASAFAVQPPAPPRPQVQRRPIERTTPMFPAQLAGAGVDAAVSLRLTVSAAGDVLAVSDPKWQITVFSDSPIQSQAEFWASDPGRLFVEAAETTVRDWKFEPAASDSQTTVSVSFNSRRVSRPTSALVPGGAVRVGGDIQPPTKIVDVKPAYPADAQASRVQGVVIIEAVIAEDGSVADAHVLRSIPQLDQAALDAVLKWRFTPTLVNGQAVRVVMTVTVNFSLQ